MFFIVIIVSALVENYYDDESNTGKYAAQDLGYATSEMHSVCRWGVEFFREDKSAQKLQKWTQRQSIIRCFFLLFGCCSVDDIEQR
jgi:hypothetical protein